jgi:hypothetical protein
MTTLSPARTANERYRHGERLAEDLLPYDLRDALAHIKQPPAGVH